MPAIIAGLRIATVSTISIATVAAFVIPKGLGRPIFIALGQDISRRRSSPPVRLPSRSRSSPTGCSCFAQRVVTPWSRAR